MNHAAYSQTQEGIQFSHPFRVTLCQVVVDCDDVNAFAFQCVEICGQSSDQSLTFTGLHLGNPALVQYHAADELHPEVLHAQASPCAFSTDRKGLWQNIVQGLSVLQSFPELRRLRLQLLIAECLHLLVQCLHLIYNFSYFLYFFFIQITEDLFH